MLTKTRVVIGALLLASSASGALAQSQIGNGVPIELMRPIKPYYTAPHHQVAPARQFGIQAHGNEVPWAPF